MTQCATRNATGESTRMNQRAAADHFDKTMKNKLNFTVAGDAREERTQSILDLCDYLTANVLEPMFAKDGVHWDRRFMNFFTFDNACDPFEPTGVILFKVPRMFVGRLSELETAIRTELSQVGIKTDGFTCVENSTDPMDKTFRIAVTDNPTVLIAPPEVNVAYTRGCVIMRDLLGYAAVDGRYEFAAEDLLKRVNSVTEEHIAACTASPVKAVDGVRRMPSTISMKSIRRCLDEIKDFALWAAKHNYRTLAAA